MNPRVIDVKPRQNYTLSLTFDNQEQRIFDVKPYLDKGIFKELRDQHLFNSVKPCLGSIQWKNGQDFCPDTLYLDSRPIQEFTEPKTTVQVHENEGKHGPSSSVESRL